MNLWKGSKSFFFGKKNQKTFASVGIGVKRPRPKVTKVFCAAFFQKKAATFFLL
jgi:hypothetical protein